MLPLVVASAPSIKVAAATHWLEWRTLPKFQRFRRLHIVVAVDEDGLSRGREIGAAGQDQRVRVGAELDFLRGKAHLLELPDEKVCRTDEIATGVFVCSGADAGDADEFPKFVDVGSALLVDVPQCVG